MLFYLMLLFLVLYHNRNQMNANRYWNADSQKPRGPRSCSDRIRHKWIKMISALIHNMKLSLYVYDDYVHFGDSTWLFLFLFFDFEDDNTSNIQFVWPVHSAIIKWVTIKNQTQPQPLCMSVSEYFWCVEITVERPGYCCWRQFKCHSPNGYKRALVGAGVLEQCQHMRKMEVLSRDLSHIHTHIYTFLIVLLFMSVWFSLVNQKTYTGNTVSLCIM